MGFRFMDKTLRLILACAIFFNFNAFSFSPAPAFARPGEPRPDFRFKEPTADEVVEMMKKLLDPGLTGYDKKRLVAVIFVHQDIYRKAAINNGVKFPADADYVKAFLEGKQEMQDMIAQRMNAIYRMRTGKDLKAPVIPFDYNNIFSDDDIITGSGNVGALMEELYIEALNQHIKEHAMRPMNALDRQRVDVNGLAWDMTQEGAVDNFFHKEKYINPQSGYANQAKLSEGRDLKVLVFENGRMRKVTGEEAKKMVMGLAVDKPLEIPGIDPSRGAGTMSDYLRMAEMHKVNFNGLASEEDIIKFIRNQKYTERPGSDFMSISAKDNPQLAREMEGFVDVSAKIRRQTTALGVATILQEEYKIPIVDRNGVVDLEKLTQAMKMHQEKQLITAIPEMLGAVQQNEAYKIYEWLKGEPVNSLKRRMLRKQLALVYAPHSPEKIRTVANDIEKLNIPAEEKAWLKSVIENDSKQIYRYCSLMHVPPERMAKAWKMDGPNTAIVDIIESENVKIRALSEALESRPGGLKFKEFLKSKTAQALNLDTMLDGTKTEKFMLWSMMLVSAAMAYSSAPNVTEGVKAVAMSMFEMIPFVSATLRFSEDEFRESFKALVMDVFPPLGLANLAVVVGNYTAMKAKDSWTETVWESVVREAMRDLGDSDFEKAENGFYRIKNRDSYLEYLKEVSPGMGRVAKLSSLVEPEIEARMSRNEEVKNNVAALYTILWFEGVKMPQENLALDPFTAITSWASKQFAAEINRCLTGLTVEKLKNRVYEQGMPAQAGANNAERVAAKIILDNLRIRAGINSLVLDSFIDRIEKRYNDLKGELKSDFDAKAIIKAGLELLRKDFEGAAEARKSPWGLQRLTDEYDKRVSYLKEYKVPSGASELDLRRSIQEVIDDFRKAIKKLEVAIGLNEEKQYLDLEAFVYGHGQAGSATDVMLLGDEFSAGIQAVINPRRKALSQWKIYYYLMGYEHEPEALLGVAAINSSAFSAPPESNIIIEAPEKKAFLAIDQAAVKKYFSQETVYEILPVIAFGDWSDPVGEVGLDALVNTIEHAEVFEKDHAAFAGKAKRFTVKRAQVTVQVPSFSYLGETPAIKVALDAPEYVKERVSAEAQLQVFPPIDAVEPKLNPVKIADLSMDAGHPSQSLILFNAQSKEGVYQININSRIKGLADEFQPLSAAAVIEYAAVPNPQGGGANEENPGAQASADLAELLAKMQGLEASAKALNGQAQEVNNTFQNELKDLNKSIDAEQKSLAGIEKDLSKLSSLASKTGDRLALAQKDADDAYRSSGSAATASGEVEQSALKGCQAAESIKHAEDILTLGNLIQEVRNQGSSLGTSKGNFIRELKTARLSSEDAAKMFKDYSGARNSRDEIKAKLQERENVAQVLNSDKERLGGHVAAVAGLSIQAGGIKVEAAGLISQAEASAGDKPQGEEKKTLNQIKGGFSRVEKYEQQVAKLKDNLNGKLDAPSEKIDKHSKNIEKVKADLAPLYTNQISDEVVAKFEKISKDARASFDAGDIFSDAVSAAANNYQSCLNAGESLYAQKTTPEAQVARLDCSRWPGTAAVWNAAKKSPECQCASGNLWDESLNSCVTEEQYYMSRVNCSGYANSSPQWNANSRRGECWCNQGYEWNNARNACRVSAQAQVAQADCSMHPNTYAGWDASRETAICYCVQGYNWDGNRCIKEQPPQYDPNAGQELTNALTGLVNTINNGNNQVVNNSAGNTGSSHTGGVNTNPGSVSSSSGSDADDICPDGKPVRFGGCF